MYRSAVAGRRGSLSLTMADMKAMVTLSTAASSEVLERRHAACLVQRTTPPQFLLFTRFVRKVGVLMCSLRTVHLSGRRFVLSVCSLLKLPAQCPYYNPAV